MSSYIIKANSAAIDDLALMFDRYRQFYQMDSNITAAKHFISDRLSLHDSIIFMCYTADKAQGFAQIYPSFSSVAMRRTWTLNDLYVNKEERRAGVARLLLNHTLEEARQAEIFSVKLVTAKENLIAKSLYQSLGFQQNGRFDSFSIRLKKSA